MGEQGLSVGHLDILHSISTGTNTATRISEHLKLPRTTITDKLRELLEHGFCKKIIAANSRIYELTPIGLEAVTKLSGRPESGRKFKAKPLRIHKIHWSSVIARQPWEWVDDLKKNSFTISQNKSWASYTKHFQEEDATIVVNPNKVHFYIQAFFVDDPHEYYPDVQAKVVKLTQMLQDKFQGLVLGTPKKWHTINSQHVAKPNGPISQAFEKHSIETGRSATYHGDKLHVDHSEGEWEEETVDDRTAPVDMEQLGFFFNEYLKDPFMPQDVHQIGAEVQEVKQQQKEASEATTSAMAGIRAEVSTGQQALEQSLTLLSQNLANLAKGQEILSKGQVMLNEGLLGINNTMGGMNSTMQNLTTSHEQNVQVMDKFAVAMHEHLKLIKGLQRNAKAMEEASNAQKEAGAYMIALLEEMQKPWPIKLIEGVKRMFNGGNHNGH